MSDAPADDPIWVAGGANDNDVYHTNPDCCVLRDVSNPRRRTGRTAEYYRDARRECRRCQGKHDAGNPAQTCPYCEETLRDDLATHLPCEAANRVGERVQ